MSTDVDVAILETRMNALCDSIKRLEPMSNRLPNWALFMMLGGSGTIGFLVNWLISCLK